MQKFLEKVNLDSKVTVFLDVNDYNFLSLTGRIDSIDEYDDRVILYIENNEISIPYNYDNCKEIYEDISDTFIFEYGECTLDIRV